MNLLTKLQGYRTYICAALGVMVSGAWVMGWISTDLWKAMMSALGFGAIAALRSAVGRATPPQG